MASSTNSSDEKRDSILRAVIPVFGRLGFRKATVEDLAGAAGLSKQGLYLHFSGKEDVFVAAMQRYLEDGLHFVDEALATADAPLLDRLVDAMDAWFGRHLDTFTPPSLDVIEAADRSKSAIEGYTTAFKARIETALMQSDEFAATENICTPGELSEVLFRFGLTWKEVRQSRADFQCKVRLCVRACCQLNTSARDAE
jgi:TetR/AcrR family transcriptional regulator, regulator of autoinduction and epiphytic fitness